MHGAIDTAAKPNHAAGRDGLMGEVKRLPARPRPSRMGPGGVVHPLERKFFRQQLRRVTGALGIVAEHRPVGVGNRNQKCQRKSQLGDSQI